MAITTLDQAAAGMRPAFAFAKAGITPAAVGALRAYTHWYATGVPGAATAPAIGVNGEAVTPALANTAGRISRANPTGGQFAYLGRLSAISSIGGALWLVDRLWQNSGLSTTLTTSQAITPAALPTGRDLNGAASGHGVLAAIEWSGTGGAGTPTATITYTNQDGVTGRTATLASVATPPIGTFELFSLQAGDTGIRSIQSFQWSATHTSGAFHLVLFRLVAALELPSNNMGVSVDFLTSGAPRIFDDSVLQTLLFLQSTSAANLILTHTETHG